MDGWRIDVANMTGRLGAADHTHEVARYLREAVRSVAPDRLLVAEHGHDATGDLDRRGWDGTMNYAGFTRPVWSWLRSPDLALPDFMGVPGGVPSRNGAAAVATMRAFAALQSWRSLTQSWTMLGSHDTARIATVIDDQARLEVAFGLLATMPGVPMVFAGDELGVLGVNGEDGRRPMPWEGGGNPTTFATLRSLIGLRRRHESLRNGCLRWVHASDDAIAYLRETSAEQLLVLARRADGKPLTLDLDPGDPPENVYGGATALRGPDGRLVLPGDGPTFQVWQFRAARRSGIGTHFSGRLRS
jgi:alpha-glucosidase